MMLEDLRIIIIDDQSSARAMLRAMLKEIGIHQVFEAPDGKDGLKFLDDAGDMVDIVICDWNMPKMTGVELLRQVRSAGVDIPFLMVTGRTDRESVLQAKTAGVTSYVAKPFSQAQLEAKLRALLGRVVATGS